MRRRIAILGLALLAGATLHGHPLGLGVTSTALAAMALAARDAGPARPWWALAGAFALVPSLRAAGWVQGIGIGGTLVFALLAAGGFATIGDALRAAWRGTLALLPGPAVVVAPLLEATRGRWGVALPAARGVAAPRPAPRSSAARSGGSPSGR